jgi:hypothetical protein
MGDARYFAAWQRQYGDPPQKRNRPGTGQALGALIASESYPATSVISTISRSVPFTELRFEINAAIQRGAFYLASELEAEYVRQRERMLRDCGVEG